MKMFDSNLIMLINPNFLGNLHCHCTGQIVIIQLYCFNFRQEHAAMEELLKRPETNIDILNKENQTPLHIAVGKNSPKCVKILMQHQANPSLKVHYLS